MRKLAIAAALASTMLATPAVARDGAWYAGVEGGLMIVEDAEFDYEDPTVSVGDAIDIGHERGFDVDLIGGYDFGMFRLEAEAAYKRAGVEEIGFVAGADIVPMGTGFSDADGHVRVYSAMGNALLDFGGEAGEWNGFVGLGAGLARVKYLAQTEGADVGFSAKDNSFAWQAVAGVRAPVSPNLDVGLKYRFFNARNLSFENNDAMVPWELNGKFRSHSLLASLVYNFAAPPPPPPVVVETPPPPPPPATQTCPDGSVILATDSCPLPPPPPPPPPPAPERG